VAEKNRLHVAAAAIRPRRQAHIAWLERERQALDQDVDGTLRRSPVWREKEDLLRSVPGVGPQLTRTLLAHLPELGALDRKRIAALVGGAPCKRDSGTLRGQRTVWGSRARVRAALYMAAPVATRHNPIIRAFYQQLCVRGKPKKVALTACMRKRLTILHAILKHRTRWHAVSPQAVRSGT